MRLMWKAWKITATEKKSGRQSLPERAKMRECLPHFPKDIYYAIRLENGNVLRVSGTQDSALALVWQLVPSLLGVLFLILVLSAVFASRLSGRVVEPLNNLDLEHPEEINVYEEVEPLISKIYRQNRQIRLQLEAARRQQKEFSIITENMQEGLL